MGKNSKITVNKKQSKFQMIQKLQLHPQELRENPMKVITDP